MLVVSVALKFLIVTCCVFSSNSTIRICALADPAKNRTVAIATTDAKSG